MAKKRFKTNISKVMQNINKDLKQFGVKTYRKVHDPRFLSKIAKFVVEMIVERTIDGYDVAKGNKSKRPMKKIKPSTITEREKLAKKGKLDSRTQPQKSNLVRTGTFIDGIKYSYNGSKIYIFPDDDRIDMVIGQYKQNRNPIDLSKDERAELYDLIEKELNNELSKRGFRDFLK